MATLGAEFVAPLKRRATNEFIQHAAAAVQAARGRCDRDLGARAGARPRVAAVAVSIAAVEDDACSAERDAQQVAGRRDAEEGVSGGGRTVRVVGEGEAAEGAADVGWRRAL